MDDRLIVFYDTAFSMPAISSEKLNCLAGTDQVHIVKKCGPFSSLPLHISIYSHHNNQTTFPHISEIIPQNSPICL